MKIEVGMARREIRQPLREHRPSIVFLLRTSKVAIYHRRNGQRHGQRHGCGKRGALPPTASRSPSCRRRARARRSPHELGGIGVTGSNQSSDDLQRLVDGTLEKWGRIDVLVNSAGHGPRAPISRSPTSSGTPAWTSI
jgi:NAD(P)-dependent dehydrogenase (short-subunit alcohol dehydrogenase family)